MFSFNESYVSCILLVKNFNWFKKSYVTFMSNEIFPHLNNLISLMVEK